MTCGFGILAPRFKGLLLSRAALRRAPRAPVGRRTVKLEEHR
jgi:hypothetical protein